MILSEDLACSTHGNSTQTSTSQHGVRSSEPFQPGRPLGLGSKKGTRFTRIPFQIHSFGVAIARAVERLRSALLDAEQFHVENQSAVGADLAARPVFAVGELGRDEQTPFVAHLH